MRLGTFVEGHAVLLVFVPHERIGTNTALRGPVVTVRIGLTTRFATMTRGFRPHFIGGTPRRGRGRARRRIHTRVG